jgi:hypothetical protein
MVRLQRQMSNMVLHKLFIASILSYLILSLVSAEGNISVTSGDINLVTPGDWNFINMFVNNKVQYLNPINPGVMVQNIVSPDRVTIRYITSSGYGELTKFNRSVVGGYMAIGNEQDIRFWPQYGNNYGVVVINNESVYPLYDNQQDLGKNNTNRWRNIYARTLTVHSIAYNSEGYGGTGAEALNDISKIVTKHDGEIDHSTVPSSLTEGPQSVSLGAVTFANSKAIGYVNDNLSERIDSLEARISKLDSELSQCRTN